MNDPRTTRRGGGQGWRAAAVAGVCLLLPLGAPVAFASTTGKLSGRVVDQAKAPLAGVNVAIPGARLGAVTDIDGRYTVIGIPAGTYVVKVSLLGYRPTAIQEVIVSADHTTPLDVTLTTAPVAMPEVIVTAKRPVVDLTRTSTVASVERKQIVNLPVQELQDVVNLQAGVVDGHFRGGRLGEVQYQVDGVTVNNVYDNASTLKLDRSLLEEVQVISGTFDAEYGQAMSGVVNAVLRRGGTKFRWDGEVLSGGFLYGGSTRDPIESSGLFKPSHSLDPSGVQNYQLTLSGPTGIPATTFLASGHAYRFDDWVRAQQRFVPWDKSDFQAKVYRPTGSGAAEPLSYQREWSGLVKVSNRSFGPIEVDYQAVFDRLNGRRGDYAFRLDPDGQSLQRTVSVTHGFDITRPLGPKSFVTVNARQNYFDYRDGVYDDIHDPRYVVSGPPISDPNYELGAVIQGVEATRFRQTTNAYILKGSWVNQYRRDQQFKIGGEFQWPKMDFGSRGHLADTTVNHQDVLVVKGDAPPTFPGIVTYHPRLGAAFAQNDLEWNDLKIRSGLRVDYFSARAGLPSDLHNPANALPPPAPQSVMVATTPKIDVSPRLGVSYPVTRDAALFFAYGHFIQMPPLGQALNNADYGVLATLQAGTSTYQVLGNPDIKPERTVQYQFGYKQAITEDLGIEVSTFYKDIRDLLGVEFITTYNVADYARLTNVDFGNVVGFTVTIDQRALGMLSTTLDYTWQRAEGNSSDPNETAVRAQAHEDPRPRQVPFTWDQRHTLNLTAVLSQPNAFSASAIFRVASGQPYTPSVATGFGGGLEPNSGRKPLSVELDLRGERQIAIGGAHTSVFARVFNAFDTRFFNGFVFTSTGSPYYSRDDVGDRNSLADPTRFYGPRRIEMGVSVQAGD